MGLTTSCIDRDFFVRVPCLRGGRRGLRLRRKVCAGWTFLRKLHIMKKLRLVRGFVGTRRKSSRKTTTTVKPAIREPYQISLDELETNHDWCLIPGLPDDVALQCLARVSRVQHCLLRVVSKPWRRAVESREFLELRRSLGCVEDWLYLHVGTSPHLDERRDGKRVRWQLVGGYSQWHALDTAENKWHALPPIPYDHTVTGGHVVLGASSAVLEGKLYVIGGAPFGKAAIRDVWVYDPRKVNWRRMRSMSTPRFASLVGVIKNKLYVIGGSGMCHLTGYSLPCLEVYDPIKNIWQYAASARGVVTSHPCNPLKHIAVLENKLCVVGPQSITGRINSGLYDPQTDTWIELWSGLRDGWGKPSTIMDGSLYTVDFDCFQRYSVEQDCWIPVKGQTQDVLLAWDPRLVSAMAGNNQKLYMVGTMGPALIVVTVPVKEGQISKSVRWHTMKLPNGVDFLGDMGHCSCQVIGY
eukprot:c25649_g1_i2 orf=337-1740(-)